jgi:hypothetical protein
VRVHGPASLAALLTMIFAVQFIGGAFARALVLRDASFVAELTR